MMKTVLIGIAMYPIIVTIASVLAPDYYSYIGNTVSDLGSQGFPKAWIMRAGFVLMGLSSCVLGFLMGYYVENYIKLYGLQYNMDIDRILLHLRG